MNQAIAFDTHRFVKRLTDCGFTERQAETLAEEQVSLLNSNLATKTEIARIEARIAKIEARIARIEAGMEAMQEETRANLEAMRQETKAQVAKIEAQIARIEAGMETMQEETRANLEASQNSLLKWIIGAIIAQGGLIATLVVSLTD